MAEQFDAPVGCSIVFEQCQLDLMFLEIRLKLSLERSIKCIHTQFSLENRLYLSLER